MKGIIKKAIGLMLSLLIVLFANANGQTAPNLGLAGGYGLFTGDTIINTDSLDIEGNFGYGGFAGTNYKLTGTICNSTCNDYSTVISDINAAKAFCSGQAGTTVTQAMLTNTTINSGVYEVNGNLNLTGTLTLDGTPTAVFIFNITGDLNCGGGFNLNTIETNAGKIIFNVGGNFTSANGVHLSGTVLTEVNTNINGALGGQHNFLTKGITNITGKASFYSNNRLLTPMFSPVYFYTGCGVKYVEASKPLNQRNLTGNTAPGATLPCSLSVTLPNNSTIIRAYLWYAGVATANVTFPATQTVSVTATGGPVQNFTANIAGNEAKPICWNAQSGFSYTQTAAYRANVTAAILTGTGSSQTYVIDGIPVTSDIDPNGVTLFIVYQDNVTEPINNGTIMIYDGLEVIEQENVQNGLSVHQIYNLTNGSFGSALPNVQSNSNTFWIIADFESDKYAADMNFVANNQSFGLTCNFNAQPQMWHFIKQQPSYFPPNQNTVTFKHRKAHPEYHALVVMGAYYQTQTTACNSYGVAGTDVYLCTPNTTTTLTATPPGNSYLWSTGQTTQSITVNTAGTYTVTVNYGGGSIITDNVTVYVNTTPAQPVISGQADGCKLGGPYSVSNYNTAYLYNWGCNIGAVNVLNVNVINNVFDPINWYGINGVVTGNNTVSVTAVNPGTGCQSTTTLNIVPCCDIPRFLTEPSMYAVLSAPLLWNLFAPYTGTQPQANAQGFYELNASIANPSNVLGLGVNFLVDRNMEIQQTDMVLLGNVKITVAANTTLRIRMQSILRHCSYMWDRIQLESGARLEIIEGCNIIAGLSAVHANSGSTFEIRNSTFDRNYYAIYAENGNFSTSLISGSTFKCTGGATLPPPYNNPARLTDKQIYLYKVTNITIGDVSGTNATNIIDDADFGIFATNCGTVNVYNNRFNNIKYQACPAGISCHSARGTAIYTSNSTSSAILTGNITIGAAAPNSANSFFQCSNGVYVNGKANTSITSNTFTDMSGAGGSNTWVRVDGAPNIPNYPNFNVSISDNIFDGFWVNTSAGTGVWVRNFSNSNIVIYNNRFNDYVTTTYQGNTAIFTDNNSPTTFGVNNNLTNIDNNIIRHVKRNGIRLNNEVLSGISFNEIYFDDGVPATLAYGIRITGGEYNYPTGNKVERLAAGDPSVSYDNLLYGISIETSENNNAYNNTLIKLGAGFRIYNTSIKNDFWCNKLINNRRNIRLENANIGTQGSVSSGQGNEFYHGTTFDKDIRNVSGTPYVTDWYSHATGLPWTPFFNDLDPQNTYTFLSANVSGCISPPQTISQSYLAGIANEEGDFNLLPDEEKYAMHKAVYDAIDNDATLLNKGTSDDIILQNFYAAKQNSAMGKLAEATDVLNDNSSFAAGLVVATIPINIAEENKKQVFEIYLATIVQGIAEFDATQTQILNNLAYQNPYYGGDAVYSARAMLEIDLDDELVSGSRTTQGAAPNKPVTIGRKKINNTEDKQLNVFYPNPTNGKLFIKNDLGKGSIINIYDLAGKLLKTELIGDRNYIDLSEFADGQYFITCINGQTTIREKVSLIK